MINEKDSLYKDQKYVQSLLRMLKILFLVYFIVVILIDYQIIRFIHEFYLLNRMYWSTYVIILFIIMIVGLFNIIFGIKCRNYLFRTVITIKLKDKQMEIFCLKNIYSIPLSCRAMLKNGISNKFIVLRLPNRKKLFLWRYRMDGSGELLLNMQYFKRLFPYYDECC